MFSQLTFVAIISYFSYQFHSMCLIVLDLKHTMFIKYFLAIIFLKCTGESVILTHDIGQSINFLETLFNVYEPGEIDARISKLLILKTPKMCTNKKVLSTIFLERQINFAVSTTISSASFVFSNNPNNNPQVGMIIAVFKYVDISRSYFLFLFSASSGSSLAPVKFPQ